MLVTVNNECFVFYCYGIFDIKIAISGRKKMKKVEGGGGRRDLHFNPVQFTNYELID